MAKVKKTNVYPLVLPALLDRLTITDVSDLERTRSIQIASLIEFLNPGVQVLIDKIFSGNIYWTGVELEHRSTLIRYAIASQQYSAPVTNLILDEAHPTLNRIDVFAVNTDSEVIVIKGTPATNPQEPTISYGSQLKVCISYIPAAAETPLNAETQQVYDENNQEPDEWNTYVHPDISPSQLTLVSTADPDINTRSIFVKNIGGNTEITFSKSTKLPVLNLSSLNLRLKNAIPNEFEIKIVFLNGTTESGYMTLVNGSFGLDTSNSDDYQTISIPVEMFQLSEIEYDTLLFAFGLIGQNTSYSIYIDDIKLIYGGENPNVLQSYLSLTDTFDDSYTGKAGYTPIVNNQELGLELKKKHLHDIEDAMVKKKSGNVNYDSIESGDIVWFKEVTNDEGDDETIVLMGDTYDYNGVGSLNKLLASSYIKVNSLNV